MSAHVFLNLLNLLEKMIRNIYLYHKIIYIYKKKSFMQTIAGQLIQKTNLMNILMYHMLFHKAQRQREVIFITGVLVQRQGDQQNLLY